MKGGLSERVDSFPLPQNMHTTSGIQPVSYSISALYFSAVKQLVSEVKNSVPTVVGLRISAITVW